MKGWKTVGFNAAIALIGLLTVALADSPIDPKYIGIGLPILGAIGTYLRSITNTSLGQGS